MRGFLLQERLYLEEFSIRRYSGSQLQEVKYLTPLFWEKVLHIR